MAIETRRKLLDWSVRIVVLVIVVVTIIATVLVLGQW